MPYTKWSEIKRQKGVVGPSPLPVFTVTYEPDLVHDGRVEKWMHLGEELVTQAGSLPDGSIDIVDADAIVWYRARIAGWTLDGIDLEFVPVDAGPQP
jgi:hypothetical protein